VHWGFASFFGTGWYSIADGGEVYAIRVKPGWTWREPELHEDGTRRLGFQFRVPTTLGAHKFDLKDIGEALDLDQVSSISFVPGVEIEIPITERWTLKPVAYLGWGTELQHSNDAWIYWTGLKSRFAFKSGALDWALINSLTYVGYSPSVGSSDEVVPFLTAVEFQRPMGKLALGGDPLFLNWHVAYTALLDEPGLQLDVQTSNSTIRSQEIVDTWEFGVAFTKGQKRLRWWRLSWDRVGLTYQVSSNGDFKGIGITFSSIFDR